MNVPAKRRFALCRCGDRRAVSLVELLVVMSISVVVLSVAMGTLHRVFQAERRARTDLAMQRTLGRLGAQLRRDVHQAVRADEGADTTDSGAPWHRLILADGRGRDVEYRVRDHVVRRVETVAGQPTRSEEFRLPDGCRVRCEMADAPGRVTMTIWWTARVPQRNPDTAALGLREIGRRLVGRIEARLGRDHRFSEGGGAGHRSWGKWPGGRIGSRCKTPLRFVRRHVQLDGLNAADEVSQGLADVRADAGVPRRHRPLPGVFL